MRFVVVLFLSFLGWFFNEESTVRVMPEICDNGIDDDMDGLIDLNDTVDCKCTGIENVIFSPSSLIPNPSFEDTLCCPRDLAQLSCAADWIQASSATSDYFHTCGYPFNPERGRPPQPLPAGDGYVGFLDIQGFFGLSYKEYVGACLNQPIQTGTDYTLQFYLGFGRAGTIYSARSPVEIVLYGTTNCANLPFGGRNYQDCPSNLPQWFEVASVVLRGSNEWVQATMTFNPTQDVAAVALGTSCNRSSGGHYYFLDDLVLNESKAFENVPVSIMGEECDPFITLTGTEVNGINYQWYRNGIAIQGATDPEWTIAKADTGEYILRVDDGMDCQLSDAFPHYPLDFIGRIDTVVCQGQSISIEGQTISDAFVDTFSFASTSFCDSIIIVNVDVLDSTVATIDTSVCANTVVDIGGSSFDSEGEFRLVIANNAGCDSIIYLNVMHRDTLFTSLDTAVCSGTPVVVEGITYNEEGAYVQNRSDGSGCEIQLSIDIRYLDTFLIVIDTQLCSGSPLVAGGNPLMNDQVIDFDLTSSEGCDSVMRYRVKILPTYDIAKDTFYCQGESVELFGQTIDAAGEYPFQLASSQNCDSTITYTVVERAEYFENIDTTLCEGQTIVILGDTLTTEGAYVITLDGNGCDSTFDVQLTYRESLEESFDSTICSGDILQWNGLSLDSTGEYTVDLVANNGCDSTLIMALSVAETPTYQAQVSQEIRCHGDSNGRVTITVSEPTANVIWADGFVGKNRDQLKAGIYPFEVRYGAECEILDTITLTQPDPLTLDLTGVNIPCMGEDDGEIIIDTIGGGTGPLNVFVNGERVTMTSGSITNLSSGRKEVRLTDENGCSIMQFVTITQEAMGQVSIAASTTEVTVGDSVVLTVSSIGIDSFDILEWTGPDSDCFSDCERWVVYPPNGESTYTLYGEDSKGCIYELSIVIKATKQFYIPNTFSPNGDRLNDFFTLFDDGSIEIIETLQIYDRWGELVFNGKNIEPSVPELGWDGTLNGKLLNSGVFVYFIEARDKAGEIQIASGDVTLTY